MLDKNVFCSSPWLHIRIGYDGTFFPCRWGDRKLYREDVECLKNIKDTSIVEYVNSQQMKNIRNELLTGIKPTGCHSCYYEESFGKMSGRTKQLYRSKLNDTFNFEDSPHYKIFEYSQQNSGLTNVLPIDLQIDIENTCNSACIMCHPNLSSRLKSDYFKLHQIDPNVFSQPIEFKCWAADPVLLQKFINELKEFPSIEYVHLLGGETLYVESFYTICEALIEADLAKNIILGTTTNGTVYSKRLEKIIPEFKGFHLGLSIESVNPLNDYIRYPSDIRKVKEIFAKFISLKNKFGSLHLELRITPNIFSIFYLDEMIQYMCDNDITAESCNILRTPSCLRMELLPEYLRIEALTKLKAVVLKNSLVRVPQNPDTRHPDLTRDIISNVAYGYIDFLEGMSPPGDVESERVKLVKFLKGFESLRGNTILDYAPEYADFLNAYGYSS